MDLEIRGGSGLGPCLELAQVFKKLSRAAGRKLHRVIVREDGLLEVEFQARNPWECLVTTYEHWSQLLDLLDKGPQAGELLAQAIIRKKCTKCFLRQRKATPGDL